MHRKQNTPHQQTKNNETTRAGRERQSIVNTYAGVTGQSWVSVFCFFPFFGRKDLRCQILQATGGHTAHCKRNGFALTKIGMTRATKNKICEKKQHSTVRKPELQGRLDCSRACTAFSVQRQMALAKTGRHCGPRQSKSIILIEVPARLNLKELVAVLPRWNFEPQLAQRDGLKGSLQG